MEAFKNANILFVVKLWKHNVFMDLEASKNMKF